MRHKLALVAAAMATFSPLSGSACTSILAGKQATGSLAVMIARTEDSPDTTYAKRMVRIPPRTHPPKAEVPLRDGPSIELPPNTFGYHALPDPVGNHENSRYFDGGGG